MRSAPRIAATASLAVALIILAHLGLTSAANSKDRYVSPNGDDAANGSASHPWKTLSRATAGMIPGSIIHVAPGEYSGPVVTSVSGSESRRIRLVSDVQWGAKVRARGSYTVWKNTADYIDIVGFDVSGLQATQGILNLGSHTRIAGNNVHDIPAPGCTPDGGAGINNANYDAVDNEIVANIVHNVGNAISPCPRVHGIYHAHRGGKILNNIAYSNQAWGIHLWHAPSDVVVANNLVFHNGEGGIVIGAGDAPGGVTADHMIVVNNLVIFNGIWTKGWAIREVGRTGLKNRYSNNLIFGQANGIGLRNGLKATATIDSDPKLIDYRSDGKGDYRLSPGSPALRAGTPDGAPDLDIEGLPRANPPDVGPYQSASRR